MGIPLNIERNSTTLKQRIGSFFKKNLWQVLFDLFLFIMLLILIVAPQTHIYFEITNFGKIQTVIDHMQNVHDNYGNVGLDKEVKTILTK